MAGKYADERASLDEVLEFANTMRRAGGANVLEALLPSEPGNSQECLIANALNFGCKIKPEVLSPNVDQIDSWVVEIPDSPELLERVSEATGMGIVDVPIVESIYHEDGGDFSHEILGGYSALHLPTKLAMVASDFDDARDYNDYELLDFVEDSHD